MVWVGVNKRFTRRLACCFAAIFLLAQTQASAHFHPEDSDTDSHDGPTIGCVVCAVASQLNDADAAKTQPDVYRPLWTLLAPQSEYLVAPLFWAHVNARAPPSS